ncbi:MAG TPA: regulatory protein RecX [Candidatus Limnocylindrales bacterium]|nr:regulatory protein RecX [Candidatus Limnocylindrales bacterium]
MKRERLGQVDDPEIVLAAALRFLEARQRSVGEVRRRLTIAGYQAGLVDGAIERLLALGILDDQAFTTAWVESRDRARPRGERALRRELQLKGVGREVVDTAMDERRPEPGGDADPDIAAAHRLLERHASALARVADPRKRRQRAYGLLARNGFDPSIAGDVVSAWLASDDDPAPDEDA